MGILLGLLLQQPLFISFLLERAGKKKKILQSWFFFFFLNNFNPTCIAVLQIKRVDARTHTQRQYQDGKGPCHADGLSHRRWEGRGTGPHVLGWSTKTMGDHGTKTPWIRNKLAHKKPFDQWIQKCTKFVGKRNRYEGEWKSVGLWTGGERSRESSSGEKNGWQRAFGWQRILVASLIQRITVRTCRDAPQEENKDRCEQAPSSHVLQLCAPWPPGTRPFQHVGLHKEAKTTGLWTAKGSGKENTKGLNLFSRIKEGKWAFLQPPHLAHPRKDGWVESCLSNLLTEAIAANASENSIPSHYGCCLSAAWHVVQQGQWADTSVSSLTASALMQPGGFSHGQDSVRTRFNAEESPWTSQQCSRQPRREEGWSESSDRQRRRSPESLGPEREGRNIGSDKQRSKELQRRVTYLGENHSNHPYLHVSHQTLSRWEKKRDWNGIWTQ